MLFKSINRFEPLILFVGDLIVFYISLWVTLYLRYGAPPTSELWHLHALPFTFLFVVWVLVFFIFGLYEKHTTILKKRLPSIIFNTQIVNSILGVLFFYLIPYFGITPKRNLFIDLLVSFCLVVLWRRYGYSLLVHGRQQQSSIIIGSGPEMHELKREINDNPRYGLSFVTSIDLNDIDALDFQKEIVERIYTEGITTIVIDTKNEKIASILPNLYNLIFSGVRFIDMHKVYEDTFDRVPLSLVEYSWFLENMSETRKFTYEFLKRAMDISITLPLCIIAVIIFPFVWLAIKIEDGGPVFIKQQRVGKDNKHIYILKVRTMTGIDTGDAVLKSQQTVTRTGKFFRASRIDELPQLWNVLRSDLSLIGPRPELPALVKHYEEEVPFYNVRHLIKPGLSGWGQINDYDAPRQGVDVEKTKRKLSYDLFYIKNRSFFLDLKIALKTINTLFSRTGR